MSKYQAYPEYKNIDNKWLDKIPSHWVVTHIKHILSMPITDGPHSTPVFLDEGVPFVSAEAVSSGRINFNKIRGHISEKDDEIFSQKYSPRLHDVYMIKSGATTGITAIVETQKRFNIWSPLAVMRCKKSYNPYFLLNSLRSDFFQKSVQLSWTFGTQQNIGMGILENLTVCYPPLAEQTQIAVFLDHETAKIDTLIEKQQKLIELLKEKRQAVISHAVTKGLNPDAQMKDSGVEWLGEVPVHWVSTPLKHYAKVIDCKHITAEFNDDGFPLASISEVKGWSVDLSSAKFTSKKFYDELIEGGRKPITGDIIYSRNATVGEAALVLPDMPEFAMGQDVCLIRLRENLNPEYLLYVLNSGVIENQLSLAMVGSTFKRINVDNIRNFLLALPPISEQEQINKALSSLTSKYDSLMAKALVKINLMQERRTALISAAVTGKIDVRHFTLEDGIAPTTSSDSNGAQQELTA